ncbi:Na+/H+ antiporter subunit E [Amnibacterium flavum]|uniref:Na+/H+ antiporter subunit E n=1 Tax=Amnibacterium flavum TaxID=2173173 RepID=A0A2V1HYQ0_9MICO|nr:Na+/H+ antiporter subunit E [Amnibacterium flavum]PVZ95977.1 Na+/H+ antiporter subunit E [Amnibacterium flavum]
MTESAQDLPPVHGSTPVRKWGGQMIQQAPLLVVLVLLWLFLWGSFSPLDIVVGILVALLVTRVFELPPVQLSGRFNPWWLLVFLVRFAGQVVAGSVEVASKAFRFGTVVRSSVIEVGLTTTSDFVMTLTAITMSLVPGSLILEVDRSGSTLFLHVLGAVDDDAIEKARRKVLHAEVDILRAVGSRDELVEAESRLRGKVSA